MNNNLLKEEKVKTNLFKSKRRNIELSIGIIIGFIIQLLYVALYFKFEFQIGYEGNLGALALAILFSGIGITLWVIIWFIFKTKFISLGFLIGGTASFLAYLILPKSFP
jgi:hypothetical protein